MAMKLKESEEQTLMRDVRVLLRRLGAMGEPTPFDPPEFAEGKTSVPNPLLREAWRLAEELDRFE